MTLLSRCSIELTLVFGALCAFATGCGDDGDEMTDDGGATTMDAGPATYDGGDVDRSERPECERLEDPIAVPGEDIGGDTYESFIVPFFDQFCNRCHGSDVMGDARNGAPEEFTWDKEEVVRANLERIRAAVGVSQFMPFEEPFITCDEQARIVRWIDSGAP